MLEKRKLAIFDLDGTLFDTKNVNYSAYSKALELCGFKEKIDYKYYCEFCNGNNYKVFLPQIIQGVTDVDLKKIHDIKKSLYSNYLDRAIKNEHLFSFIDLINSEYYIALVTTASFQNTEEILNEFEVKEKFDLIVTQEDVSKTKPEPEGFLLAMRKYQILAEDTIIFEDSEAGMRAAKISGAKYVKVYGYN